MSELLRITAVSYLNTAPFVYGLTQSQYHKDFKLSLDVPAECARKLLSQQVDVGLVPTFAILNRPEFRLISNFCIGAVDNVRTVVLLSNTDLKNIKKIYLDNHSRTSVHLVRVLAQFHWKIDVQWVDADISSLKLPLADGEALLAIGDKVFGLEEQFAVRHDLAKEWYEFTGLPMVFAVWVSQKPLAVTVEEKLTKALAFGVKNIPLAVESFNHLNISSEEAVRYLTHNISYVLDEPKRKAVSLFEHYVNRLNF